MEHIYAYTVSLRDNHLMKGMNPSLLLPTIGK